jgi:hypothetical protein
MVCWQSSTRSAVKIAELQDSCRCLTCWCASSSCANLRRSRRHRLAPCWSSHHCLEVPTNTCLLKHLAKSAHNMQHPCCRCHSGMLLPKHAATQLYCNCYLCLGPQLWSLHLEQVDHLAVVQLRARRCSQIRRGASEGCRGVILSKYTYWQHAMLCQTRYARDHTIALCRLACSSRCGACKRGNRLRCPVGPHSQSSLLLAWLTSTATYFDCLQPAWQHHVLCHE